MDYLIFDTNIFQILFGNSTSITLFIIFTCTFIFGTYLMYSQVALVLKGEFKLKDRIQCLIFGFIFALAIMIVISMAFIFAIDTPSFWKTGISPPPKVDSFFILFPFFTCLLYLTIYPIVDFIFISLSRERDEGLTPFHSFFSKNVINKNNNKKYSLIMAIAISLIFIMPPLFIFPLFGVPLLLIWIFWALFYPLLILNFYGSKGYIAGISNQFYHIPEMKRYLFLNFEDPKRGMKQFNSMPFPYILFGLMLFVYVWAWISLIQTINYFFTGSLAISTMSSYFVYVTLFFGIIGYFTRFWGRKVKYRGIDIYFSSYLIAAIGINVLVNFLIVNINLLSKYFNSWVLTQNIVLNYKLYVWPSIIEEVFIILFTTYFFLSKKSEFKYNIKISKITECGQTFDTLPLFNLIKSSNKDIRVLAEQTLILLYERIPLKSEIDINDWKYKNLLLDCLSDSHPNAKKIAYKILVNLETAAPNLIYPWINEILESPNHEKVITFIESLIETKSLVLLKKIPKRVLFNLLNDNEWRLKILTSRIISLLIIKKEMTLTEQEINQVLEIPNITIQINLLNAFADSSFSLPYDTLIKKFNSPNQDIKAAVLRNLKNINLEKIHKSLFKDLIKYLSDPNVSLRSSIFELISRIGSFKKLNIPINPLIEGLFDPNPNIRHFAVLALEKLYHEDPRALDLDQIIMRIDPNNREILLSIISFLGKIWDKDPVKILTAFLTFIKMEDEGLKEKISDILVEKSIQNPSFIIDNLIKIREKARFISKGIISRTIINIANKNPSKVLPILNNYLKSPEFDVKFNTILTFDGLINTQVNLIDLDMIVKIIRDDPDKDIKKIAIQFLSNLVKKDPSLIINFVPELLKITYDVDLSLKILIFRILLNIAKNFPDRIPLNFIIEHMNEKDSFIRETCTKILGFIGYEDPKNSIKSILKISLKDDDWIVRDAAISSLGNILANLKDKSQVLNEIINLLDDENKWVKRSSMKLLSSLKDLDPSKIPFNLVKKNIYDDDPKVREGAANLLVIYAKEKIEMILDDIIKLLGDESEFVRKTMIDGMVKIINSIGLSSVLSTLLKNLSDETSLTTQQSIAIILSRTAILEEDKIKKRIISLLKIRCEVSQDPIICNALTKLREK